MSHPIQQKVRAVARRAHRLTILHGASWVIGAVVAAAFLLGLTDYLIRLQDHGVRFIFSLALLGVLAWTTYRFLYPALRRAPGDLATAQRIESRYPQLGDELSSTVAFLAQSEDDVTAGSAALRRAVITQTADDVDQLNLSDVIDRRQQLRGALAAAAICLFVGLVCLLNMESAGLAARRLAFPFGGGAWPTVNDLAFLDAPRRMAIGEDLEVELIDRNGRLPEVVTIHYWFEDQDERAVKPRQMTYLAGKRHQDDKMVHRLAGVMRSFKYRATGGDHHTMQWIPVAVVQPPRVASMTLTLRPPDYTGWPAESSGKHIRALEGTQVHASGTVTRPLASLRLKRDGVDEAPPIEAQLSQDGYGFSLPAPAAEPWVIGKSGTYRFQLVDRSDALEGGIDTLGEIRAVPDRPPAVSVERPSPSAMVTRSSLVPVRVLVKDDLAIHTIHLRYSRSEPGSESEGAIELFRGADVVPPREEGPFSSAQPYGQSLVQESMWDLSTLSDIEPGDVISLYIVAADYKPQAGQSPAQRLTVVTADELESRIAERQAHILDHLAEVLKTQRESRSQTASLEIQLEQTSHLAKQDIDHLQSAELNQRRVARGLTGQPDGVQQQIAALLAELKNNRLDSPEIEQRLRGFQQQIDHIGREHLPVIQRELISALKSVREQQPPAGQEPDQPVGAALAEAGRHQEQVIAGLERLLGRMSQWDSYRRFSRQIGQLLREQEGLQQQTSELELKTLTEDVQDLSDQQRADLAKAARQQLDMADRLERIQGRMEQMHDQMKETDAAAADTVGDALQLARRQALGGQMRQSSRQIGRNHLGQASRLQEEIAGSLREMLDVLADRRENRLSRLVEKLREAEAQLDSLRREQQGLRKKMQQAAGDADKTEAARQLERLAKQQQPLAEQLNRFARRLERLRAEQAGGDVGRAAASLDQSAAAAQRQDPADALEQADKAQQDLEQAQRQLAQRRRQAEADLAREQVARMKQLVTGLHLRQQNVLNETVRLESIRVEQDQLTRAQVTSVGDLASQQRHLAGEVGDLAQTVSQVKVFQLALVGAVDQMQDAAGRLSRFDTGPDTQLAERGAMVRLAQLLEAMKDDDDDPAQNAPPGGRGEGQQNAGSGDQASALAQLKLLKLMQEEINARTAILDRSRRDDEPLSPRQQLQLQRLIREQGQLADLIFQLTQPEEEHPEDDPDSLPDVPADEDLDLDSQLDQILPDAADDPLPPRQEEQSP